MKTDFKRVRRGCAAGAALLAVGTVAAPNALLADAGANAAADSAAESPTAEEKSEAAVRDWPGFSRGLARAMIDDYGPPQRVGENMLAWDGNGPWKRSVVYRNGWPNLVGMLNKDNLEQTIGYRVPEKMAAELKRFDARITVDEAAQELSARSESEKLNYLALNLAEEIITEKRSAADARDFYRKAEELSKSGKSSPYLEGFVFSSAEDKNVVSEFH